MLCLLSFVRIEKKPKTEDGKGICRRQSPLPSGEYKCGTLLREVFRIAVLFLRDRD